MPYTGRRLVLAAAALASALLAPAEAGAPRFRARQLRPVSLGTSGGNPDPVFCYAGTLGCLVRDAAGAPSVLSNAHVLAGVETAAAPGTPILQPGTLDGDCVTDLADEVARLTFAHPVLFFGPSNEVDAGIAAADDGAVRADGDLLGTGPPDPRPAGARVGMVVRKAGRTTGVTAGRVAARNVTILVDYGLGRVARFERQIRVAGAGFSRAGDSGSLVVDARARPVGLLFAGGRGSTFANRIDLVIEALGIQEIVGTPRGGSERRRTPRNAPEDAAAAAQSLHGEELLALPGVLGHGLSRRGATPVLEVYSAEMTPILRQLLPRRLDGVPVRAVVTGPVTAH